jgi:hypothetical protein
VFGRIVCLFGTISTPFDEGSRTCTCCVYYLSDVIYMERLSLFLV